jgi:hypothetical protein
MTIIYIFLIAVLIFIGFQLAKANNLKQASLKLKEGELKNIQETEIVKSRFPHLYHQVGLKDDIDNYNYILERYSKLYKSTSEYGINPDEDTSSATGIIRKIKDEFVNNEKYNSCLKKNELWIKDVVDYSCKFIKETKETKEITSYELDFVMREVWWRIYETIEKDIELDKGEINLEIETIKDFWFLEYLDFFPDKK